jgi:hypothetical protein
MFAAMASTIRLVMDISGRAGRNYVCTQLIFSLSMFSGLWPNHDFCLTSTIRCSYGLNFFFFFVDGRIHSAVIGNNDH